jgi:hypothetical protein
MTPEDLLIGAFEGATGMRCPVVPKIWCSLAARLTDTEPRDLIEDPALVLARLLDAAALAGCDAARMLLLPKRATRLEGGRLIEVGKDGRRLGEIDLNGGWATHLERAEDFDLANPEHIAFRTFWKHPGCRVQSLGDVRRIALPDRAFWRAAFSGPLQAARAQAGDRVALIGDCDSATLAWYIEFRGMEQAMFDLVEDPALVHAVMEQGVAYAVERGKFFIDEGLRVLRVNDSVANMSVISPAHWREFILPHLRTVCAELHRYRPDVKLYCHICGNVLPVMADLATAGLDGLGPLDPLGGFTVAQARAKAGPDATLIGGVDTMAFIEADPRAVYDQARRCIREGQVNGSRYVLSSGCAVPPESRLENLLALRQAAEDAAGDTAAAQG